MLFKSLIAGVSLSLFATSLSYGQVMLDVSKVTCEQFYFSRVSHPTTLSIWLSGFYHGKHDQSVVDVQRMKENADKLHRFCRQRENHKVPILEAAERALGK